MLESRTRHPNCRPSENAKIESELRKSNGNSENQMGTPKTEWELRRPNGNSEDRMGTPKTEWELPKSNRNSEIYLRERVPGKKSPLPPKRKWRLERDYVAICITESLQAE